MNTLKEKIDEKMDELQTQPIKEGKLTKKVENQTAKIPSMAYLNLALGSLALSAGIKLFTRKASTASFVGLWVPTFLLLGLYNKIVKIEGNDRYERT
jgi:hypothetical protein